MKTNKILAQELAKATEAKFKAEEAWGAANSEYELAPNDTDAQKAEKEELKAAAKEKEQAYNKAVNVEKTKQAKLDEQSKIVEEQRKKVQEAEEKINPVVEDKPVTSDPQGYETLEAAKTLEQNALL